MSFHKLKLELGERGELTVSGTAFTLQAKVLPPRFKGEVKNGTRSLSFDLSKQQTTDVAGLKGNTDTYRCKTEKYTLELDLFYSNDCKFDAIRLRLINTGDKTFNLASLYPLDASEKNSLIVGGTTRENWRVLRMSRHKNDVPGIFRPGVEDIDFEQAGIDGAEIKAGRGVSAEAAAKAANSSSIKSEPLVSIKNDQDEKLPAFCVAVLGQTEHLSNIFMSPGIDENQPEYFSVEYEFDGIQIKPGESRLTHWTIFAANDSEQEILDWHTGLLEKINGCTRPNPNPPSIYCSWYFYGYDFTQADLDENLAELRKRPIPIDYFLIDHGWMDNFGTWNANSRFPDGMEKAAEKINNAGYIPGIWTCPFVLLPESPILEKWPDLVAVNEDDEPCVFLHSAGDKYVLDPTSPHAEEYLTEMYKRFESWGYHCHKLDFLRAIINCMDIRFHDRSVTRAQAYRIGLSIIRRAIGPDSYLLACGGLFEGSIGWADGLRIGSDVKGRWSEDSANRVKAARNGQLVRIKQNIFRNHTNRFWHTDPDALQLRRRKGPFRGNVAFEHLADGSFSDDEAFTCVVNQYLGGGMICFSERMVEFDDDRLALLRHLIPAASFPAKIIDWGTRVCPTRFLTKVTPRAEELDAWHTLTVCNWEDAESKEEISLECLNITQYTKLAVFEFATQSFLGVFQSNDKLSVSVPAHGSRVLRIAVWNGKSPIILGTDMHLSGGAVEFSKLNISSEKVTGTLDSPWMGKLKLSIGIPYKNSLKVSSIELELENKVFDISLATIEKEECVLYHC